MRLSVFSFVRLPLVFAIVLSVSVQIAAQSRSKEERKNPVETIEEGSEGRITIEMSPEILNMILSAPAPKKHYSSGAKVVAGKMSGYRIQVFSDGRNQASLEARARARGNAIASRFPKYRGQVYTFSKSPNWYTRVGNFRTLNEANAALRELRRAFPGFASEMRAVKCQIYAK